MKNIFISDFNERLFINKMAFPRQKILISDENNKNNSYSLDAYEKQIYIEYVYYNIDSNEILYTVKDNDIVYNLLFTISIKIKEKSDILLTAETLFTQSPESGYFSNGSESLKGVAVFTTDGDLEYVSKERKKDVDKGTVLLKIIPEYMNQHYKDKGFFVYDKKTSISDLEKHLGVKAKKDLKKRRAKNKAAKKSREK